MITIKIIFKIGNIRQITVKSIVQNFWVEDVIIFDHKI